MHPPVIAFTILGVALWLTTTAVVAAYLFRKLQLQERLAAIARGADLTFDPEATANRTRRSGIVCIAAGLGLSIGDVIVAVAARDPMALVGQAVAIVPVAVGLGLLVDYRISRRELRSRRGDVA
jgi:hypothetical protein